MTVVCEWRLCDCTCASGGYVTVCVYVCEWRLHDCSVRVEAT